MSSFLGVELQPNLVILVPAMVIGVLAVLALGIFMAGWCLQLRQEAWSYPEAIAGGLYLVSGAIFPIDILPAFVQPIAYALPTTWWLEATRRGLLGHGSPGQLGTIPDGTVMLILVATTAITVPLALDRLRLVHEARPPGGAARHDDRELIAQRNSSS